jgi:hypothetical protein
LPDEDEVPVPAPPTTPAVGESSYAHAHRHLFWAHDDDEERDALIDAIRLSEDALCAELRREREEMEAAVAAVEAAKRAERKAAIASRWRRRQSWRRRTEVSMPWTSTWSSSTIRRRRDGHRTHHELHFGPSAMRTRACSPRGARPLNIFSFFVVILYVCN